MIYNFAEVLLSAKHVAVCFDIMHSRNPYMK